MDPDKPLSPVHEISHSDVQDSPDPPKISLQDPKKPENKIRDSIDHELLQELRQKFQSNLSKLSDTDTREVGLKEAKKLIERNSSSETLKIFVSGLSDHIKSKSSGAREQEVHLYGFLAQVYRERLIEESTPLRMLIKIAEGIQSYFRDLNRKVQEAAAEAFCALFKYCLPKTSQQLIFNFMFEPLNSILTSGLDVQAQQTAALTIFKWACMLIEMQDAISLLTLFNKTFSLFLKLRAEFLDLLSALGVMLQKCGFYPILDSMNLFLNKINSYLKNPSNNSHLLKYEACKLIGYVGKYLLDFQYSNLEKLPTEIVKNLKELRTEKVPILQSMAKETLKIWECYSKFLSGVFEISQEVGREKLNHFRNVSIAAREECEEEQKWGVGNKGFLRRGTGNYSVIEAYGQVDFNKALEQRPSVKEFLQKQPFSQLTKSVEILYKENQKISMYERPQNIILDIQIPTPHFAAKRSPRNHDSQVRNSNEYYWLRKKSKDPAALDSDRSESIPESLKDLHESFPNQLARSSELRNSNEKFWLRRKPKSETEPKQKPDPKPEKNKDSHKITKKPSEIKNPKTEPNKPREFSKEKPINKESFPTNLNKSTEKLPKKETKKGIGDTPDSPKPKDSEKNFPLPEKTQFQPKSNLKIIPESIEEISIKSKPIIEAEVKFSPTKPDSIHSKKKSLTLCINQAHTLEVIPHARRKSDSLAMNSDLRIENPLKIGIQAVKTMSLPITPKENNSIAIQTTSQIRIHTPKTQSYKTDAVLSIVRLNTTKLQKIMDRKFENLHKSLDFIEKRIEEASKIMLEKKKLLRLKKAQNLKIPPHLILRFSHKSQVPILFSPKNKNSEQFFDSLTHNWSEVLVLIKNGQIVEGIAKVLAMKDDLYLLRLMHHIEPCLAYLPESLGQRVIGKLLEILESRFVEKIGLAWIIEADRIGILENMNKDVQKTVLERLKGCKELQERSLDHSGFIGYAMSEELFN